MKKLFTFIIICGLFANSAYGSGFQLNEHGARAMAMAGAFTGLANDPSAIYFNPAGITQLNGTQFMVGATMIMPLSTYTSPAPALTQTSMNGQVFSPVNFYFTTKLGDRLAVGLSVNNQYGLGTQWDPNWIGKYLAVETKVTTFFFTPVIAYKLMDNLSISAGPTIAMGNVLITNKVKNPNPTQADPLVTLKSDNATAVGFTAGLLWRLNDMWQFGLSYRSQSKFDFKGTATSSPATFVHPLLKVSLPFPNGGISAPLTTPQNATFGIAYTPNKEWTATFDLQYVGWSSYDVLAVTFDTYDLDLNPANGVQNVESVPRKYKDTYIARMGFEYTPVDNFALRFGLLYDHNPVQDAYVEPTLPDADRWGYNIGFGGKISSHLGVDVSYMYLSFADRNVGNSVFGFNGSYSNSAHLFGVDFTYSL